MITTKLAGTRSVLLLLVLSVFVHCGEGAVYGVATVGGGDGTQTITKVVQVNLDNGNLTDVTEALVYVGSSIFFDGISAYDHNNNRLFFATNYEAAFVYNANTESGSLLPPISLSAEFINTLAYDGDGDQLLVDALFEDHSEVLVAVPYSNASPSKEVLNFTTAGIGTVYTTTYNSQDGIYYLVYYTAPQLHLASFPLNNPQAISKITLSCGTGVFAPDHIFYDPNTGKLLGVGYNASSKLYEYFEILKGVCTTTPFQGLSGIVLCATHDVTRSYLYFGYLDSVFSLVQYDTVHGTLTKLQIDTVLSDVQVSFEL